MQGQLANYSGVAHDVGWEERGLWTDDVVGRYRAAHKALERSRAPGDRSGRTVLAAGLRVLADDLLARGLTELIYATALGQPERAWVNAGDVARRHAFDIDRRSDAEPPGSHRR